MNKIVILRIGLILLLLTNLYDCMLTAWGLTANISTEFNPLLNSIYKLWGLRGLIISKILISVCVVSIVMITFRKFRTKKAMNKFIKIKGKMMITQSRSAKTEQSLTSMIWIVYIGSLAYFIAGTSWLILGGISNV